MKEINKVTFVSGLYNCLFSNIERSNNSILLGTDMLISLEYPNLDISKQISLKELLEKSLKSTSFYNFGDMMNSLDYSILYKSDVHGIKHIERTALLTFFLCTLYEMDEPDIKICLECAKYHDLGRNNDKEEPMHGLYGAQRYIRLVRGDDFSEEETKIIAYVIAAHSLDDCYGNDLLTNLFDIPENNHLRCKKILHIVKDADALDRFRLTPHSLNIRYLRLEKSVLIVKSAFELWYISEMW